MGSSQRAQEPNDGLMTGSVVPFVVLYYIIWAQKSREEPLFEAMPYSISEHGASHQGTKNDTTGFNDSVVVGSAW